MTWINHDIYSLLTRRVKTILKASDLLLEIKKMGKEEGKSTHVVFFSVQWHKSYQTFPQNLSSYPSTTSAASWGYIKIYPSSSQRINPCFTRHLLNQSMISSSPMSCSEKCWMNLQVEQWPGASLFTLFLLVDIPPSSSLGVKFLFFIFCSYSHCRAVLLNKYFKVDCVIVYILKSKETACGKKN